MSKQSNQREKKKRREERLTRGGIKFPGYNKPVKTPGADKSHAVLAKKGDEVKMIRFGSQGASNNESKEEREAWLARHSAGSSDLDNKLSAGYWAKKVKWPSGQRGSIDTPKAKKA